LANMNIGSVGVWTTGPRQQEPARAGDTAAELEDLGYGAIWCPPGVGRSFEIATTLLTATKRIAMATAITSIWEMTPAAAAAGFASVDAVAPGRFLLGLGVSHAPVVARDTAHTYERPLAAMREFLQGAPEIPRDRRIVAALGPKMLQLAAAESLGTHPYLVTIEQTARIREQLGVGPVIAVEQAVVLEPDQARAREIAREHLRPYLQLPNYVNNWLRDGYQQSDVENDGSDRLVDALVAWGDLDAIDNRIKEHRAAGADHVCLQVLGGAPAVAIAQLRIIAGVVT
jgi:probable F420-dependent oxidoreductase